MLIVNRYVRRLSSANRRILFTCGFILLFFLEEYFIGFIRVSWRSSYSTTIYRPITTYRNIDPPRIALVSIVYDNSRPFEYSLSEATVGCYAILHNYTFIKVNLQDSRNLLDTCMGKDFMFQRHCVVAHLMKEREDKFGWFLFIDSDMGVVNPSHLIEEYIDHKADLTFYDRLYNYEIMAGSYLAKNTEFARSFLRKWSLYERKLKPGSFQADATDNGALHEVILDEFCSNCSVDERRHCTRLWAESTWYEDLFLAESCGRTILGARNVYQNEKGTLRQLSNAVNYWARDGWQTDNRWSTDDFIIHGWKTSKRNRVSFGAWISPFTSENFDTKLCEDPMKAHLNWAYKDSFMKSRKEIKSKLQSVFRKSYIEHLRRAYQAARLYQ